MLACVAVLSIGCLRDHDADEEAALTGMAQALTVRSSLTIGRAAEAPVIDGRMESVWTTGEPHAIARSLLGERPGLADSSAYFRTLWDQQYVYLFVEVNDDALVNEVGFPWEDDSVEIYLDGDAAHLEQYDDNDFQYVFRWRDPEVHVGVRSAPPDPSVRFAQVRTASGYALEVAVPWSGLGGQAEVGRRLGMDVHVNDDDDGGQREAKIAWAAEVDDAWEHPSAFLPLVLEGTPPSTLLTVIPAAAPLPLLDGRRDEQFLRSPSQPIGRPVRGSPASPADLTASWRALHDEAFLYLVVEVTDDRVKTDDRAGTPWEDDAVELFLDGDGSDGPAYDGVDDVHLVLRPADRVAHLGLRSAPVQTAEVGVVTTSTARGYVLEAYVPWSAVHTTWSRGKTFRMDVHVNDDDDGGSRDAKVTWWSSDDEAWQLPERFGRVRLGPTFVAEEEDFASFEGLGDLSGGARASVVMGMDQWGSVVVGTSEGNNGREATRWTRSWGLHGLGSPPSTALAVSPSGTWIVGGAAGGPAGAVALWRGSQFAEFRRGAEAFPGGPPMFSLTAAHVIFDDATVYASCVQYGGYGTLIGCRLDGPGRITLIFPADEIFAADGLGHIGGVRHGYRQEPIGSVAILDGKELGYPAGSTCVIPHACRSEVRDFSDGAAVAVGKSVVPPLGSDQDVDVERLVQTAFVYTSAEGMLRLPDLAGGLEASAAYTVSADGARIAGFGTDAERQHAVLWIDGLPQRLQDVARAAGAHIPEGWRLSEVIAMSADGRVLVGNGINPAGAPEGYRVAIPQLH